MNRRFLLESLLKTSRLPSAFQEVEYIESTGTQYIDTGVLSSNNLKISIVAINTFGLLYNDDYYGGALFGSRVSSNNSNYSFTTGSLNDFVGNGNSAIVISKNTNVEKIYLEYDNSSISYVCDDYSYINNSLNVQITSQKNVFVLARNDDAVASCGTFKLFSCQIYDNNILVRNFVPCYRKADSVAGLYDLVNGVFYTNAGTGTFIVGGNV